MWKCFRLTIQPPHHLTTVHFLSEVGDFQEALSRVRETESRTKAVARGRKADARSTELYRTLTRE